MVSAGKYMLKLTLKVEFWELIPSPGLVVWFVVKDWRRARLRKTMKNF
jgi:hypothetical protein